MKCRMSVKEKILNPKAKAANVVLAIVYVAVFAALFAGALCWQFSTK